MCGEKLSQTSVAMQIVGSPPRVRGKERHSFKATVFVRDHPRVCGEKFAIIYIFFKFLGSPPRVRGKGPSRRTHRFCRRITPACTGKSVNRDRPALHRQDHPRVCGEKQKKRALYLRSLGSPPRVRGKAGKDRVSGTSRRITPACAGKSGGGRR